MLHTRRRFLTIGSAAITLPAGSSLLARAASASIQNPIGPNSVSQAFSVRSTDGTRLAAQAQGNASAPEILFIHGLRQSRLSWDKQFADPALTGFRLVRFDLRGHGDSDKPEDLGAYSDADRWADDVSAVIAAAKLRRPVIVGWSLGGHVAGAYLRKHGGSGIAGVNLVDAVTKLSPDLLTRLAGDFARTATSHDLVQRVDATADFLAACFHRQPSPAEFRRLLVVNGMAARAANEGFLKSSAPDLEPVFAAYRGPILLTHGARDRLVRLAMSERIKSSKPGTRLSVFAGSGHSPFFEEPKRFGAELAAFTTASTRV